MDPNTTPPTTTETTRRNLAVVDLETGTLRQVKSGSIITIVQDASK